ncbi:MAG TPA: hypothetical protein VKE74_10470 [Gemmataceae bacterium]|nr:hypothetical protein [Gemmataceae bacterium]
MIGRRLMGSRPRAPEIVSASEYDRRAKKVAVATPRQRRALRPDRPVTFHPVIGSRQNY